MGCCGLRGITTCCDTPPNKNFDYKLLSTFALDWILNHIIKNELPQLENKLTIYKQAKYIMLGTSGNTNPPTIYINGSNYYWENAGFGHFYDQKLQILYIVLPFIDHKFPQLGLVHPIQIWNHIPVNPIIRAGNRQFEILNDATYKQLINRSQLEGSNKYVPADTQQHHYISMPHIPVGSSHL